MVLNRGIEIFVFDMGKPVKITDLAKKMIQLSGKIPEIDIKTVFTVIQTAKIKKAILKSTMSPGIKIDFSNSN